MNFYEIGQEAFRNGESSAPTMNAKILEAIEALPVGGGAKAIMKQFVKGWHDANLQEM